MMVLSIPAPTIVIVPSFTFLLSTVIALFPVPLNVPSLKCIVEEASDSSIALFIVARGLVSVPALESFPPPQKHKYH